MTQRKIPGEEEQTVAKQAKSRKKRPAAASTQHNGPILDVTEDGIASIAGGGAPGYPSFMSMLSPAKLIPMMLPTYPDHVFWHYMIFDSFLGIAPADIQELKAMGWVPIGRELEAAYLMATGLPPAFDLPQDKDEEAVLYAHSQLSRTLFIHEQGGTMGRTWIRHDDLQTAQRNPVLLCYMMPKALAQTTHPADIVIGTHALIETEQGVRVYSIDQLGDEGDRAWQEMHLPPYPPRASTDDLASNLDRVNLHIQVNSILHERAIRAAKVLARSYWQLHEQSLAHPSSLPALPDVFEKAVIVPMSPPLAIRGVLAAYSNAQSSAGAWQESSSPYYLYQDGKESARVEFHPTTSEPIWEQIHKLTDLDGDVLLALVAQWLVSPKDAAGYTWITAEHLLHYRGILPRRYLAADGQKRQYQHRYDDLIQISDAVGKVRDTHVSVQQWIKQQPAGQRRRGRPSKQVISAESYLIQISEFLQQERLFNDETTRFAIAWRYSLGRVILQFLKDNQRISTWLQRSLSYDPVREEWEKRLSRFLIFQEADRTVSIRYLFSELSLRKNEGDPDKTRRRFEKALNRLAKDLDYFGWAYKDNQAELPSKRWLERWMDFQIELHIPGEQLPTPSSSPLQMKGGKKSP
jgi:hypothetical protein